jgi:hypothetical protein
MRSRGKRLPKWHFDLGTDGLCGWKDLPLHLNQTPAGCSGARSGLLRSRPARPTRASAHPAWVIEMRDDRGHQRSKLFLATQPQPHDLQAHAAGRRPVPDRTPAASTPITSAKTHSPDPVTVVGWRVVERGQGSGGQARGPAVPAGRRPGRLVTRSDGSPRRRRCGSFEDHSAAVICADLDAGPARLGSSEAPPNWTICASPTSRLRTIVSAPTRQGYG